MPITDHYGSIVATPGIVAGNHHDCFDLKPHLQTAFKTMKGLGLKIVNAVFNADSAFDTRDARKACFNHRRIPNVPETVRNRKRPKRGRKHFANQRTFAWIDKFRALLLRFDRPATNFLGGHYLAYAMINLRHLLAAKV